MKKLILFFVLAPVLVLAQTHNQNYVKNLTYIDSTSVSNPSKALIQVNYFDGLGRAIQSVSANMGSAGEDIITAVEYDQYGRQIKDYLPYADVSSSAITASFRPNAIDSMFTFYNQPKYENTANPYAEKYIESSPLNRIFQQAAPGYDWRLNHTVNNYSQTITPYSILSCGQLSNGNGSIKIIDNMLVVELNYDGILQCSFYTSGVPINTPFPIPDMNLGTINNINGESTGYYAAIQNGMLYYFPEVQGSYPTTTSVKALLTADLSYLFSSGHTIKYDYQTNKAGEVRKFDVSFPLITGEISYVDTETPSLTTSGFYASKQLYKQIVKDENWTPADGKNKTTEQFTNKKGQMVLKRNYNNSQPHDTYYLYDVYGNLSYVIPPTASDNIVVKTLLGTTTGWNLPWTRLALVDQTFADAYDHALEEYDNDEILNVDLIAEYGGQGGISIMPGEGDNLSVSIVIGTTAPMKYRTGIIASLDNLGTFTNRELGRIAYVDSVNVNNSYEYIFTVKDNNLEVTGSGPVPSINTILSGSPLDYRKNHPFTALAKIDPAEKADYEAAMGGLPNSQILSTYTANPYGAMGGVAVSVDESDTVTVSVNITATEPIELSSGASFPLGIERGITNRDLGGVQGYKFSIVNNSLVVTGSGLFNNLTFNGTVAQQFSYNLNQAVVDGLCYIYHYDYRNRVIEKHIPDNGWTHMVYDKLDRVILTQDENQRANNKWLFTKYDQLGRVVYTGDYTDSTPRKTLQQQRNTATDPLFENRSTSTFTNNGLAIYYTNQAFPTTNIGVLTVGYFDTYPTITPSAPITPGITYTTNTTGLATMSQTVILDTTPTVNSWITTLMAYDEKARPVWTMVSTPRGGIAAQTLVETKLDFTGKPIQTYTRHVKSGQTTINIYDYFTYNDAQQLLKHTQKINNGTTELIDWNSYDELGQLQQKKVGGDTTTGVPYGSGNVGLQTVDYTYNIRGWLKGINDVGQSLVTAPDNDLFAFKINYNAAEQVGATALYNGNIAETYWKSKNDDVKRRYSYSYDALNRLLNADYADDIPSNTTNPTSLNRYREGNINYDKNGNILNLERWGLKNDGVNYDKIDALTYQYEPVSNKLKLVSDAGDTAGFNNGTTGTNTDYTYDIAGNLKTDANKGITNINYNHLNLPTRIDFGSTKRIEYLYDATGKKLRKAVTNSGVVTNMVYVDGFIYQDNVLQFFNHAEGYVKYNAGTFTYIYQYKDHLGSTRLTYFKNPTNNELEIIEEDNYYAFGLKHKGYNNVVSTNGNSLAQKYKYNGKELQDELGLNSYDFGARNYDPSIGRWMNIDPLAENSRRWTPYNYAYNNPMYFVDPDGMQADDWVKYQSKSGNWQIIYDSEIHSVEDAKKKGYDVEGKGTGVFTELKGTVVGSGESVEFFADGRYIVNGNEYDVDDTTYKSTSGLYISENKSIGDALGDFGPKALRAGGNMFATAAVVSGESVVGAEFAPALAILSEAFLMGAVGAEMLNEAVEDSGKIYRVPGDKTSSGKPYIGRTKQSSPEKRGRGSNDGRDRKDAEVIDTYDPSKPGQGAYKEQRAINREGGTKNLDNKRNEVNSNRMRGLEDKYGTGG